MEKGEAVSERLVIVIRNYFKCYCKPVSQTIYIYVNHKINTLKYAR